MKNTKRPIGIFDSGLGGLTVLKQLQEQFPNESFIYIGDTAHLPYGNKSATTIINCSELICDYLVTQNVKLIIIACNTVSSLALKAIKKKFTLPIIDVITPVRHIVKKTPTIHKIGVIGTYNTIQSKAYYKTLKNANQNLQIFEQTCPLFVPIIEEGLQDDLIADLAIKKYLDSLITNNIELLILGCTHYPLLMRSIAKHIPNNIKILDSASATADYLKDYLLKNKLAATKKRDADRLIITDKAKNFKSLATRILNQQDLVIELLNLTT